MNRGAQWAIVHGITESDKTKRPTHTHTCTQSYIYKKSDWDSVEPSHRRVSRMWGESVGRPGTF